MIPKIVHHSCEPNRKLWMPIWNPCYDSWRRHFPHHHHWNWSNRRINVFVREKYPQYFYFFQKLPKNIMRYDISRYLLLHYYGGIYADMDTFVYRDFTNDLLQDLMIVAHPNGIITTNNETEFLSNWLMSSVAGHQFFIDCVELSKYRCEQHLKHFGESLLDQDLIHQVLYLTGPFVVGQIFKEYKLEKQHLLSEYKYTSEHFFYHADLCVKHIGSQSWTGWIPGVDMYREGFEYLTKDFNFYQSLNYNKKSNLSFTCESIS